MPPREAAPTEDGGESQSGRARSGHEKFDIAYVLDRKPTYVVIGTYGLSSQPLPPEKLIRLHYPAEVMLVGNPVFRSSYRLRRAKTPGGYFGYFERIGNALRGHGGQVLPE